MNECGALPAGMRSKCRLCKCIFYMCHSCYRGHLYCSSACVGSAKKGHQKKADRRYRATKNGQAKRRASQNRYRKRQSLVKNAVKKGPCPKKNSQQHEPISRNRCKVTARVKNVNDQSSYLPTPKVKKNISFIGDAPNLNLPFSCKRCGRLLKDIVRIVTRKVRCDGDLIQNRGSP
jgi:hypothetical protein